MNSIQISIEAGEEQQEVLISELSDLGADGFEQNDHWLIAYFSEHLFKSYEVNEVLKPYTFTAVEMEERNWNEVWEASFQPVTVSRFCAIRAEFHEPVKEVQHEIIITPKMSFGTGHHATTYMMIEQMEKLDFRDRAVFDFGTGTGILAILAEKLGAAGVTAIDMDDWSIANARENCTRNDCRKVQLVQSSTIPGGSFDIILANINRNVLIDQMPILNDRVNDKGFVLLSGLLVNDEKDIVAACSSSWKLVKRTERNKWIALLFVKESTQKEQK